MDTILKRWMNHKGLTVGQLAHRLNTSSAFVSEYANAPKQMRAKTIKMFADALEITPEQFTMGPPSDLDDMIHRGDFALIQQRVLAGNSMENEKHPFYLLAFHTDYIMRVYQTTIDNMFLLRITSMEMAPTLIPGDYVMILTNRKTDVGAIFLIQAEGKLFLRRIIPQLDGTVILSSDNTSPDYPTEKLKADQFIIIGQATWFGRMMIPIT